MNFPYKIKYIKAANYTLGRAAKVTAIVNHRMVGYLSGTDSHFQQPTTQASTHFGIGIINGVLEIHQYVPLDDSAWGNGNYDPSGVWDDWGNPTTNLNARTISIEHQDYGDPKGTGVVSESIQKASIFLQAFLLRGTIDEWRAAGIVFRVWTNAQIVQNELRAIPIDGRHIITHNDISGKLKPYCWKPWSADTIGFPRQKYVDGIKAIIAPPPPPAPVTYTQAQLDAAVKAATDVLVTKIGALTTERSLLIEQRDTLHIENTALTKANTALHARMHNAADLITTVANDLRK